MKGNFDLKDLRESDKRQVKSLLLVICLVGVVLVGTSYAWLTVTKSGAKSVGITAGTLNLVFDDSESNTITLADTIPVSDSEGLNSIAYTFKVTNTGNINSNYTIYIDDVVLSNGEARMDDNYVKYGLVKNDGEPTVALLSSLVSGTNSNNLIVRKLSTDTLVPDSTDTYTFRIWLDENNFNSGATNKTLSKVIRIEATQQSI